MKASLKEVGVSIAGSQVQIFFALLSSIALKYDAATLADATNIDILLTILLLVPALLTFYLETPIQEYINSTWRRQPQKKEKGLAQLMKARSALRAFSTSSTRGDPEASSVDETFRDGAKTGRSIATRSKRSMASVLTRFNADTESRQRAALVRHARICRSISKVMAAIGNAEGHAHANAQISCFCNACVPLCGRAAS